MIARAAHLAISNHMFASTTFPIINPTTIVIVAAKRNALIKLCLIHLY
jgi:hypothetical protein